MRWEWKLFFSNEKFRGRNPNLKKLKNKKRPHFIFLRLEAEFFLALKPSLQCHQTFVKVGFPDRITGLWAFEGQMPYQKYQGPPIVVRCETILNESIWNNSEQLRIFRSLLHKELCNWEITFFESMVHNISSKKSLVEKEAIAWATQFEDPQLLDDRTCILSTVYKFEQ